MVIVHVYLILRKILYVIALDDTDEILISEFLSIDNQDWFPIAKKISYPGFTWDETLLMYEGLRTATAYNQNKPNVYKAKWGKTSVDKDSVAFLDINGNNHYIDKDGNIHILSCTRFIVDGTRAITEFAVDKSRRKCKSIKVYLFLKEETKQKNYISPWYTNEDIQRMFG